jgi:hypothetical protein
VRADGFQPERTQRPRTHVGIALPRRLCQPLSLRCAHELLLLFDQAGRDVWITVRHGVLSLACPTPGRLRPLLAAASVPETRHQHQA